MLFPIRLDDAVIEINIGWPADIRHTRHIGDFRHWKDHDAYQRALERLLRDLKSSGELAKDERKSRQIGIHKPTSQSNMKVFISYSRKDEAVAHLLAPILHSNKIQCQIDRELRAGAPPKDSRKLELDNHFFKITQDDSSRPEPSASEEEKFRTTPDKLNDRAFGDAVRSPDGRKHNPVG